MTQRQGKEEVFNEAYTSLNSAQREAVDSIEGPVMVIAGPGTGKTQILTLRIANILLKTDTAPESILALTFTESGARAMRERLRSFIGAPAYRVPIFTFHGFAGELIRSYPDAYPNIIGGRPATALEKVNLIETILEDTSFKVLRPLGNPTYHVSAILREIADLKKEYVEPDSLAAIIEKQETELASMPKVHEKGAHQGKVRGDYQKKEKNIAKNRELLAIYRQYQTLLRSDGLYDFEDMMLETVHALEKNEDMLRDLQESYHYLLADEHQDVNQSQNRILEALASYHHQPNIFVVGDEKQAIYRFQGASLENFLYFEDKFPQTKTIALVDNYRSGQTILDAAHALIAVDDGPLKELRVPLTAVGVGESGVSLREFSHSAIERSWVMQEVAELLKTGVEASEVAIIVRTNAEVESIAADLRRVDLPVSASADSDLLEHPLVHAVLALIKATTHPENETALFVVLHGSYWGISPADLVKLLQARSYQESLAELVGSEKRLSEIGIQDTAAILNVAAVLSQARKLAETSAPQRALEYLLDASGLLTSGLSTNPHEVTRVVRRLYDEIESLVAAKQARTLSEITELLAQYQAHGLALTAPALERDREAVQVMTAHKAKGLEFSHVFVPGLSDQNWGGKRGRTSFDIPYTKHVAADDLEKSEDDRRLLYVAITRAKQSLFASSSVTNELGREFVPSRYLEDISTELLPRVSVKEEGLAPELGYAAPESSLDLAWLQEVFLKRGFSATSLNNYLRSPWDYFYRNVLRIPEAQALHLQYGTALHGVMQEATARHTKAAGLPSPTELSKLLDRELGRLPLTKEEFVRLHEQGLSALTVYLEDVKSALPKETKEEFSIRVSLPTGLPELPEIPLSGNLDRLDIDEGQVTQVVDYKTGKPKTRGHIEGTTKDSDGDYKRQLVFYTLLLSLLEDERYQTKNGLLSFLEPDSKGKIHHEQFLVTDEEIAELKTTIIEAATNIVNGSFLVEPCDPERSSYCDLVESLRTIQ